MLQLNLPKYNYRLQRKNNRLEIWDDVRKKWVILTPEEWVRQHFLHYLLGHLNVPIILIRIESGMRYNRLRKRTDVIAFNRQMKPWLLVECKAPQVAITNETCEQAGVYASKQRIPFIALTNGLDHYFFVFSPEEQQYLPIDELLVFEEWV